MSVVVRSANQTSFSRSEQRLGDTWTNTTVEEEQLTMSTKTVLATAVLVLWITSWLHAQAKKPDFKVPDEITFRTANIMSEGTRMAAEVFAPKEPQKEKLPTIVMCHGWGGIAQHLRADAIVLD